MNVPKYLSCDENQCNDISIELDSNLFYLRCNGNNSCSNPFICDQNMAANDIAILYNGSIAGSLLNICLSKASIFEIHCQNEAKPL